MPAWPGTRLPTISVSPRRENRDTNARCADVVGRAVLLHPLGTIAATCHLAGPDWVLNSDRAAWGQDAVSSLGSVQVVPLCEERYRWSPESSAPVAGPRAAPRLRGRRRTRVRLEGALSRGQLCRDSAASAGLDPDCPPACVQKVFRGPAFGGTALLDRLLHRCHIVNIRGNSYRMRRHAELSKAVHPVGSRTTGEPMTGEAPS